MKETLKNILEKIKNLFKKKKKNDFYKDPFIYD